MDLEGLKARAQRRIETSGAPWITGTEVLALIAEAEEAQRLRKALEQIATFRGEEDLPERLRAGTSAAIRFHVAVEPIRIARETLVKAG